jgi:exopolysaccharide biosynthesis polyprenyl glycosylphosphotransferase
MYDNILSKKEVKQSWEINKNLRDLLDGAELLIVLLCVPLSYLLTGILISNINFPIYTIDFKLFVLRYLNYFNYSWQFNLAEFIIFCLLILICWHSFLRFTNMARLPRNQRYMSVAVSYITGNFFILLVLLLAKFIFGLTSIPVIFIFTFVAVSLPITLAIRFLIMHKMRVYRAGGNDLRQVIIIADENYTKIIDKLLIQKEWGYKIYAIISGSPEVQMKYQDEIPVFAPDSDIKNMIDGAVVDEILYCKKDQDEEEITGLITICNEIGVIFRVQSCESIVDPMQIILKTVNQKGKLTLVDIPAFRMPLAIKTFADIYLSLMAMILLAPFFLIMIILIKFDSRGPVFFKQERVGLRGRKFRLYKFRTMVENAEELLEQVKEKNEMDGPTFKMKNDPRITKLGKFMRKTGIDEFPQLINVVRGDMSLIGPRPPLESEVKQYERWHLRRLSVKPGITCTWQVMPQRNDIKFEKWMHMDMDYIDNWSLGLDLKLVFKTVYALIHAGGR